MKGRRRRTGGPRAPRRPSLPFLLVAVTGALVAAAAVVGFALSSAGGRSDPPASPAAGSQDPVAVCSLVTDPVAAFGREPIASPNTFTVGGNDRCLWVVGRDPTRYVGVTVGPAANHAATIVAFGPGEAVELGDAALWWPGNATLSVVAGERNVQVDLNLDESEATLDRARAVARQVLAALG